MKAVEKLLIVFSNKTTSTSVLQMFYVSANKPASTRKSFLLLVAPLCTCRNFFSFCFYFYVSNVSLCPNQSLLEGTRPRKIGGLVRKSFGSEGQRLTERHRKRQRDTEGQILCL